MKNLYFLRHGESEYNKSSIWTGDSDSPLTSRGKKQALKAAKSAHKNKFKPDLIISSPLMRAYDTAVILAKQIDYPIDKILVDKRIVERDFGELDGKKQAVAYTKYFLDESAIDNFKGVEKLAHLQKRVDDYYDYLCTLEPETILIVGHGAFARALRRRVKNLPIHKRGYKLKYAELVKFI